MTGFKLVGNIPKRPTYPYILLIYCFLWSWLENDFALDYTYLIQIEILQEKYEIFQVKEEIPVVFDHEPYSLAQLENAFRKKEISLFCIFASSSISFSLKAYCEAHKCSQEILPQSETMRIEVLVIAV